MYVIIPYSFLRGNNMEGFIGFLKYGGLGLSALVCVAVLVFQAKSLHGLISDTGTDASRLTAATPVLKLQMCFSLVGLLVIGGGALALAYVEAQQKHCVRIAIEPGESVDKASGNLLGLARIKIDKALFDNGGNNIEVVTIPGKEQYVHIDIMPYVKFKLQEASKLQAVTVPLEASNGLSEPEI
jgi:hypothetical protein